jgi:hypothetical protein
VIYERIENPKGIPQRDMFGNSVQGRSYNSVIEECEDFYIRPHSSFDQHFGQLCGCIREWEEEDDHSD